MCESRLKLRSSNKIQVLLYLKQKLTLKMLYVSNDRNEIYQKQFTFTLRC